MCYKSQQALYNRGHARNFDIICTPATSLIKKSQSRTVGLNVDVSLFLHSLNGASPTDSLSGDIVTWCKILYPDSFKILTKFVSVSTTRVYLHVYQELISWNEFPQQLQNSLKLLSCVVKQTVTTQIWTKTSEKLIPPIWACICHPLRHFRLPSTAREPRGYYEINQQLTS